MENSLLDGKSLVELDCAEHNALVDLSRKIVTGSQGDQTGSRGDQTGSRSDQTGGQGDQAFSLLLANSSPQYKLEHEYLSNLTLATDAPKTTNLYELAEGIDSAQQLAEAWAEEYTATVPATTETNISVEKWREEFSILNLTDTEAERESENSDVSNMLPSEFFARFHRSSKKCASQDEYFGSDLENELQVQSDSFKDNRVTTGILEQYVFKENNPYLHELDAFEKGKIALESGMLTDAFLYLEAAVKQNQENCDAWYLLGNCQAQNEYDIQAIAAYKTALNIGPERGDVKLALAATYINESMNSEALELLEDWVTSFTDNHSNQFRQHSFQVDPFEDLTSRIEKVEQLMRKMLMEGMVDDQILLHNALSLVYNIKNDYDRAAEELRFAIMNNPEDCVLWNRLGATLANGKKADEAVAAYREALEICPNYARAYSNLGIAHMNLLNFREAIEHFITALQLQQYCGSITSSVIWTSLSSAVVRSVLPDTMEIMEMIKERNLEKLVNSLDLLVNETEEHSQIYIVMVLLIYFVVLCTFVSCNPLLPDQAVIPLFDSSNKNVARNSPTSTYGGGRAVDVVEEWDFITSPPHKVISTIVRSPNAMHDVDENSVKEIPVVYDNDGIASKSEVFAQGVPEMPQESQNVLQSSCDEKGDIPEEANTNPKAFAAEVPSSCNNSAHSISNMSSTIAPEVIRTSSTVINTTLQNNKVNNREVEFQLQLIDFVESLNAFIIFSMYNLFPEVESTLFPSETVSFMNKSIAVGYTGAENVDSGEEITEETLEKAFLKENGVNDKTEVDRIKEIVAVKNAGLQDHLDVETRKSRGKMKTNLKLDPQVIPQSEFAKNGIESVSILRGCSNEQISSSTVDGEEKNLNCETDGKTKTWKSQGEEKSHKYGEEVGKGEELSVMGHFEKSLWEKLVAGLKCSQRDCGDALRPTESVRRYLVEPSISRARKHSSGVHSTP